MRAIVAVIWIFVKADIFFAMMLEKISLEILTMA